MRPLIQVVSNSSSMHIFLKQALFLVTKIFPYICAPEVTNCHSLISSLENRIHSIHAKMWSCLSTLHVDFKAVKDPFNSQLFFFARSQIILQGLYPHFGFILLQAYTTILHWWYTEFSYKMYTFLEGGPAWVWKVYHLKAHWHTTAAALLFNVKVKEEVWVTVNVSKGAAFSHSFLWCLNAIWNSALWTLLANSSCHPPPPRRCVFR